MWRKALVSYAGGVLLKQPWWRTIAARLSSSSKATSSSVAVNSILLRSLKDHYLEVSKMTPPPKVSPPSPFTVVKGSIDSGGAVLKRSYGEEEIGISVMRLANIIPGGGEDDDEEDDGMNQLFVHVEISKPGQHDSLHFLCGLYPDALGIHSVSMRSKMESSEAAALPVLLRRYNGPTFEHLDEKMRDALHGYIEERGINESLFPFLQAWLYVKDHRNLMRWFKSVGTFVTQAKEGASSAS
ncbi:uncharacterized protein [Coffea arabica]|uniref:Mitochondrial acidic protein MAM33-like n=1 Tax=Coffea arabica TaxID=13443 RepID=A0A6P6W9H2_COFAR|nr:uncharacterized protein At2g39795, mitochondrial-like [Coffea arabica]